MPKETTTSYFDKATISELRSFNYQSVLDSFHKQSESNPQNIAISFNEEKLTYEELRTSANQLAQVFLRKGLKKGEVVALVLSRSPEIIISILAVLSCGGVYVPIDPEYPEARIEFMINDTTSKFVVIHQGYSLKYLQEGKTITIEQAIEAASVFPIKKLDIEVDKNDLAYIIYTSGSTGQPKGAMITHGNILHFLKGMQNVFKIKDNDKFLSVSSISFDASCFDIYLSLVIGAELLLADTVTVKDGNKLLRLVQEKKPTIMLATPVTYKLMLQAGWNEMFPITVLSAGEPLQPALAADLLPRCKALYNVYGPTETTVICIVTKILSSDDITIGVSIEDTPVYLLDAAQKPVKENDMGEIYIGGNGVGSGYINRPELTAERFIKDPFKEDADARMYKSGDLGKLRKDGKIEYLGRTDDQVKIRGFRVELGEIQSLLAKIDNIHEVVVLASDDTLGEKQLIAYVSLREAKTLNDAAYVINWKNKLAETIPAFMIPDHFIIVDAFPVNENGKIDKKALPHLTKRRPEQIVSYRKPKTEFEKSIVQIWNNVLEINEIGVDDNFFELGGNSLSAHKMISLLKTNFNYNVPVTKLYQYPTISGLQDYIQGRNDKSAIKSKKKVKTTDIAIIGMECDFPGANTIDEFWQMLSDGKETITFFTNEEIDVSVPENVKNNPDYIGARGIIKDVEKFDAEFFGISPKLAEIMDPQHRVFLQLTRNLLEKTGYLSSKCSGVIGVFAGCNTNTYYSNNVIWHKEKIESQAAFSVLSVTDKDYVASRVSYQLNLNGPAVNVNSACSTSLLAVAQAVDSIRAGQCTMAIAGGVAVNVPLKTGHLYDEGSMKSIDGHTRPFDKNAKGTVFSDGAGAVLLKSLEDAKRDGDIIYAVIKGVGISNDGGNKGSFSAPNAQGQFAAIDMAIKDAATEPSAITYIETHGTATPIGDPIEIEGLKMAFANTDEKQFCDIGSVKSNFGHLTHASGVAGLIKTVLSLYYKKIPPTINYEVPNEIIDFKNSPFIVNDKLKEWNTKGKRIAGVSSFGVGGTNVHIVLEEHNDLLNDAEKKNASGPQLICFSARNIESANAYADRLATYIDHHPLEDTADIAYSLQRTRENFAIRCAIVARDNEDLKHQLKDENKIKLSIMPVDKGNKNIVFMFPGQGSQFANMGKELYLTEPVYKNAIDECAEILINEIGEDIRGYIFPEIDDEVASAKLQNTRYTQPSIFITSYAFAKLYMSWGIMPSALVGHSIGEFVAAQLAGVFSLKDALKIIAERSRMISELEGGTMLSVRSTSEKIEHLLPTNISVAAMNAPNLCVLSGDDEAIIAFSEILKQHEIVCRPLRTSHAFHSQMMDPIIEPLKAVIQKAALHIPQIPILSTVTGAWMKDDEAKSATYWANHSRLTVRFSDAIQTIEKDLEPLYLEVGAGTTTSIFVRQQIASAATRIMSSIENSQTDALASVRKLLGRAWQYGTEINWRKLYSLNNRKILHSLPTYAYNKKTYWLEPPQKTSGLIHEQQHGNELKENKIENVNENKHKIEMSRKQVLIGKIKEIIESASGIDITDANPYSNFIELGLDSLLLTQIVSGLKKEFNSPVTFRQLNENYDSLDKLANYFDEILPENNYQPDGTDDIQDITQHTNVDSQNIAGNDLLNVITRQLNDLSQKVTMLQNAGNINGIVRPATGEAITLVKSSEKVSDELTADEKAAFKKPFGATARIETKSTTTLNNKQKEYLKDFIKKYTHKTQASKAYTQKYRKQMADPRVVSGFKPLTKEMVYSIVMKKSLGCYLWDIDDNKYIDALNGFGSNFLGYQPDVLKEAIIAQVHKGYEIGPQHELAGEVSQLICEFTGFDRAALCNTGSEAVLGALRIARTVTGRELIVAFTGSYHGINDEVLVRGTKKLHSFPAASGILKSNVQNMLILEYGTEDSLNIIKERANEIAAVLVEPVQSRRPEFQPLAFLERLRELTINNEITLIFDEVITGFRSHPGGVQALFNIKADIATYGKVVGGGLSIGVIAGKSKYINALDGGFWQYGDDSIPEVGVTYFAGTFVRHPLVLATAKATLLYLKNAGPILQQELNIKTTELANSLNKICSQYKIPLSITHFGSLWRVKLHDEYPYHELLFSHMRLKGIHIWDGFPCFLTTAHTTEDITQIIMAFEQSVAELIKTGFILPNDTKPIAEQFEILNKNAPPLPGARLGKDAEGNPGWYIEDTDHPGKYIKVENMIKL